MAATPLLEEAIGGHGSFVVSGLAGDMPGHAPLPEMESDVPRPSRGRRLQVYSAHAAFDLLEDLDPVVNRVLEPNVFFSPRFLVPAMPRLDERDVRLMVVRDGGGDGDDDRIRFLLPFSIEKPGFNVGHSIIRGWSHPFGPLGTPLVDTVDSARIVDDALAGLANRALDLPKLLVLPDMRIDGAAAGLIRAVAIGRNLPVLTTSPVLRPALESRLDGDAYLRGAIGAHHRRDLARMQRKLASHGPVAHSVARSVAEVRYRMEEFLALEGAGWKGRQRTALVSDRYRAAFAREAVNSLAERDNVRIHTIDLAGEAIASLIVFVAGGEAWTWKTAFNETWGKYSPGRLLAAAATGSMLDDPNIDRADSCAVPDHPVMSHLWTERIRMATMVIGLRPDLDRETRQVASQIDLYRSTRNAARIVRDRLRSLVRRD